MARIEDEIEEMFNELHGGDLTDYCELWANEEFDFVQYIRWSNRNGGKKPAAE